MIKGVLVEVGLSVVLLFTSWAQAEVELQVVSPQKSVKVSLALMKQQLKSAEVEVYNPAYSKKMTYQAFRLDDVLKLAGASVQDHADELVFTATDGYSPNMKFSEVGTHQGYLAFQEKSSKGFTKVSQGKAKLDPGPFLIVWTGEGSKELPWPYQLVKIEVVDWNRKFALVVPPKVEKTSREYQGFELFKAECIRCHSINLQGGDIGPELNAPKNVTEYWTNENLHAFIQDSNTFRYKSKMPAFKKFKSEDLDTILAYLKHMRDFKIPAGKSDSEM